MEYESDLIALPQDSLEAKIALARLYADRWRVVGSWPWAVIVERPIPEIPAAGA